MAPIWRIRRAAFALLTGAAVAIGLLFGPIVTGTSTPAAAQMSEDAQIALEQYGMWRPHPRFGDVLGARRHPGRLAAVINTGTGSTPMNGAGTGCPTTWRPTGAGSFITTADGRSSAVSAGSGCQATSGRRRG